MKRHSRRATRSLFTTEARKSPALCSLEFLAGVLIVAGFFGPWLAHRAAALAVTGYELSEFAKFFPQVQGGTVPVTRALFLTPLLAGAISLALVIHRSSLGALWRLGAMALTAMLCLTALPPFQYILAPDYRMQLILVAGGALLAVAAPLARRLSERLRGILFSLLAVAGAVPALRQVVLLRPLAASLYGSPILPGWGLVTCATGFFALLIAGLRGMTRR